MHCSTPGFPVHHQLLELTQTHVHWVGDAIQPSHPLSSPSPPAFNLSQHQGLSQRASSSHQWPKYWSFSFSISPSNEYSWLISFRMDWLDLLAVHRLQSMGRQRAGQNWVSNLPKLILYQSMKSTQDIQIRTTWWLSEGGIQNNLRINLIYKTFVYYLIISPEMLLFHCC